MESITDVELTAEASSKSRAEWQSFLRQKGIKATGTNKELREHYIQARRLELGLVAAADANLPFNPQKKSLKKKALSPEEQALKKDAEIGWQYSNAKAALKAAIMDEEVPLRPSPDEDEEDLKAYFDSRPEIQNHGEFEKFKGRLQNLRDQIRNDMTRAEEDEEAFMIFAKNHPKSTVCAKGNYPEWEGHEAQKLLEADMKEGYHTSMEPAELWMSEEAYTLLPLKVFREHVYQAARTKKYLNHLKESGKGGNKWKDYRNPKDGIESSDDE
jgi:hypothetical protein